jgi:hypothetical protein
MDASAQAALPPSSSEQTLQSYIAVAHGRVQSLWARLSVIDPHACEGAGEPPVRALRKLLQQVLADTESLAAELMERCDSVEAASTSESEQTARVSHLAALSNVCFMAISESRAKQRDLIRISFETDPLRMLSACGSALRRLRKALASMEVQLALALRQRPAIDGANTLRESLEIRKAYGILRKTAEAGGPPSEAELPARLRALDLRIQLLSEKDLYLRLRLDDRLQLSSLRQRLQAALNAPRDPVAELRLWQDALGFAGLLSQVNLRQELREHDAAIVGAAAAQLLASDQPTVSSDFVTSLRPLLGLSDELDELLRFDARERARYAPVLAALDASFRLRPSPQDLSAVV